MCDDTWDGWDGMDDSFNDPDNDFEEDLAYEAGGDWYEDGENLIDELEGNPSSVSPNDKQDSFDLADAMLLGMIGGAFYDAAREDKQQLKRAKFKHKKKK